MQLFTPGKEVVCKNQTHIVDYVSVSGYTLLVYLIGLKHPVPSHLIYCEPTEFALERMPDA